MSTGIVAGMPSKPLKVFLSYSHLDSPKLLRKFRNHLDSLEKDRIIKVWFDRNIAAGDNWDNEIHASLHDCHLFVALTSANFSASSYIDGQEMRVAWERHERPGFRIFPVLWERWRLTERWRPLQFVPGDTIDVIGSDNPNDAMYLVVAAMERVAAKLAAAGTASQTAPTRPIDASLPYLCDWTEPIRQLQQLKGESDSNRPLVLAIAGGEDDCVDNFLRRTHREEMATIHSASGRALPDVRTMAWPGDSSRVVNRLYATLDARPETPLDRSLPEGMNVLQTMIEGWSNTHALALEKLLQELQQPYWTLTANRALVLVIRLMNPGGLRNNEWYSSQIADILKRFSAIRSVAIAMPEIDREEARSWFKKPEVKKHHSDQYAIFDRELASLYGDSKTLRMKPLAEGLLRILNQFGASA